MKKLLTLREIEIKGKQVLVRMDLDVPTEAPPDKSEDNVKIIDNSRIVKALPTLNYLYQHEAGGVWVAGHVGNGELSNLFIAKELGRLLKMAWTYWPGYEITMPGEGVQVLENLRRVAGEKENNEEFAKKLVEGAEVYVNEAFAVSHRKHASVDAVPRLMKQQGLPVAIGLRFEQEIEQLDKVFKKPGQKVLVIGGAKAGDKTEYAKLLADKFERVVIGGRLPEFLTEGKKDNMEMGKLRPDGLDIDEETISKFKAIIGAAEVIVVAGPMGKYEDEGSAAGTREVVKAVAESRAYKIAGGGDTEAALAKFGVAEKFDWISVGGGAMLEYLSQGTLAGLESVKI